MFTIMCVLKEYFNSYYFLHVGIYIHRACPLLMCTTPGTTISRLIHLSGTTEAVFGWGMNCTHVDVA